MMFQSRRAACALIGVAWATAWGHDGAKAMSICDDIQRASIVAPDVKQMDARGITRGIQVSPDGSAFFVATESGNCETNKSEVVLRVFQMQATAEQFQSNQREYPSIDEPREVARLNATANEPLISRIQWQPDGRHLLFIGRNGTANGQVFRVSSSGGD